METKGQPVQLGTVSGEPRENRTWLHGLHCHLLLLEAWKSLSHLQHSYLQGKQPVRGKKSGYVIKKTFELKTLKDTRILMAIFHDSKTLS